MWKNIKYYLIFCLVASPFYAAIETLANGFDNFVLVCYNNFIGFILAGIALLVVGYALIGICIASEEKQ